MQSPHACNYFPSKVLIVQKTLTYALKKCSHLLHIDMKAIVLYQACLAPWALQTDYLHCSTQNLHHQHQFRHFQNEKQELLLFFVEMKREACGTDGNGLVHACKDMEHWPFVRRYVASDVLPGLFEMAEKKLNIRYNEKCNFPTFIFNSVSEDRKPLSPILSTKALK